MEKLIDLHIHTNISDGAFSPKEAFKLKNKLNFIVKHEIQIINHNSNDHNSNTNNNN